MPVFDLNHHDTSHAESLQTNKIGRYDETLAPAGKLDHTLV